MPQSTDSHLSFWNVSFTNCGLRTFKAKVTFDPNTAYPWFIVSANKTYVESGDRRQNVPDNPERFNNTPALLGHPGFTSGKLYWEVEYGDQREWAVGVALERVDRKVYLRLSPEEGIWQKGLWWLRALENRSHALPVRPGIIGIFLNYKAGTVAFYIQGKLILKRASFNREKVFPFFYLGGGVHLKLI
ncbi:thaicobrin-like isoform X2 [Heteronotia binoei]|uniref:thaicobrin-like isoform X2 n=1 Tax=Heteronotia binoei TaxID=13085 RepID=UPI00293159AF|nr:thaicobrin-like isoform X2 [Heteronotia binoei]